LRERDVGRDDEPMPPVTEPMTAATDLLLGAVSLVLGARLLTRTGTARRLWGVGLALSGLGAWSGGAWHAFHLQLTAGASGTLWKTTMLLVGAAATALVIGSARALLPRQRGRPVVVAALVQLAIYAAAVAFTDAFVLVIVQYGLSLLTIAALFLTTGRQKPSGRWILGGIGASVAGAVIQAARIAPHPSFNHDDLFHVVQIAAAWLFYRGAAELGTSE
jgi:hypothetical protein